VKNWSNAALIVRKERQREREREKERERERGGREREINAREILVGRRRMMNHPAKLLIP
jgi:hypothetical protein